MEELLKCLDEFFKAADSIEPSEYRWINEVTPGMERYNQAYDELKRKFEEINCVNAD